MHSARERGSPNDDVLSNQDVEWAHTISQEVHVLMWYSSLKDPTGTQAISVFPLCCPWQFCPYYVFGFLSLMFVKAGNHWENKSSSRSAPSAGFCWHLIDLQPYQLDTSGCHGAWKVDVWVSLPKGGICLRGSLPECEALWFWEDTIPACEELSPVRPSMFPKTSLLTA